MITKVLFSSAAVASLFMCVACGDDAPTYEEYESAALSYQATHRDGGAGGDGGGGVCQLSASGAGAACDACLNQNCCNLIAVCQKDAQCSAVQACVAACQKKINPQAADARAQYNACGAACYQANPSGVQPFNAASTCVDNCTACR